MKEETGEFDVARYLDSEEAIALYLQAVIETNDPVLLKVAEATIARARNNL
jgi:probable addiction module antidote protein